MVRPHIALIDGFPQYQVDTLGRVFALPNVQEFTGRWGLQKRVTAFRQLKDFDNNGYRQVTLYKDGMKYRRSVHRLVAQTFIPNPENLPEVNHINECRSDNRVENLEWTDRVGNAKHSCYKTTGSLCGTSVLTESDVIEIRYLIKGGYSNKEISDIFNVHHSTISKIRTGVNWANVQLPR